MKNIKGKNVLITGGAMGMGKLYVEKAISEGATVIIWDINTQQMDKTAEQMRRCGGTVHTYRVDVSSPADIESSAAKVLKEIGTIDVLFNNAGIVNSNLYVDQPYDKIDLTMRINAIAPMLIARAFLPGMLEKEEAHIINISSAAGYIVAPKIIAYCASKWAALGFSNALRKELEETGCEHVKVTTVCPGLVTTGMFSGAGNVKLMPPVRPEAMVAATPARRMQ